MGKSHSNPGKPAKDARVDQYIAKSAEFARPILMHLRDLVHTAVPEVKETIKWGIPHFDYKGTVCAIAAFKEHCAFGFWKASLMSDSKKIFAKVRENAMGDLGRITTLKDLPSDKILISYIKEAAKLNEQGIKVQKKTKDSENREIAVPDYLQSAIKKNKKAALTFENFSYSNKKEYVEWLTEAKTEETRNKRLATALEWMAEGKIRNWKYVRK